MIASRATLDVPRELAQFVAELLLAGRRRRGTPEGRRALTWFWQTVLGLRWFRDRTAPDALARDHGISRATAYRYVDELIAVLAEQAPGLISRSSSPSADGKPDIGTAPAMPSSAPCAASANAGSLCSPSAGALSSTSPPAPARPATLPAPHSSSPISSAATSNENR